MAEITKVTTPMIPRENVGGKYKPVSDQALDLHDVTKVQKKTEEKHIGDREAGGGALRENLGRAAMQPVLRDTGELTLTLKKIVSLLQLGISTSDIVATDPIRQMLQELFVDPDALLEQLRQQEESSVLFRGDVFDALRAIADKFPDNARIMRALSDVLKIFEQHVNAQNSVKTILYNCRNILDYLFSQDRDQFSSYLDGLERMLLPEGGMLSPLPQEQQEQKQAGQQPLTDAEGRVLTDENGEPVYADPARQGQPNTGVRAPGQYSALSIDDQREIAHILKNNLLPLLGEIVVKYHQNERVRDIVMVVVHNIVRVDKGTEDALLESVERLVRELTRVANLPERYEDYIGEGMLRAADQARFAQNDVITKLTQVIAEALHSGSSGPAALRQSENLLLSLLHNQSSMMDVLHFILPMQTPEGRAFTEMYVDPDTNEHKGKSATEQGRKIFLSVDSEGHGSFEFCFWQIGDRVDFSLWCPQILVGAMSNMRRAIGDIMQVYGYSMKSFSVEEFVRPQTIAQVFPKLLNRKVGIDVRV